MINVYKKYIKLFFYTYFLFHYDISHSSSPILQKELLQKKVEGVLTLEQYEYIMNQLSNLQSLDAICTDIQETQIPKNTVEDICISFLDKSVHPYLFRIQTVHEWIPEPDLQKHSIHASFQKKSLPNHSTPSFLIQSSFHPGTIEQYYSAFQYSSLRLELGHLKFPNKAPFLLGRSFWSSQTPIPIYKGLGSPSKPYLNGFSLSHQTPHWSTTWWSTRNQNSLNNNKINVYLYGVKLQGTSKSLRIDFNTLWQHYHFSKNATSSLWLQSLYLKDFIWDAFEFRTGWVLHSSLNSFDKYPAFGWVQYKTPSLPIQVTLYQTRAKWHNPLMGNFSRSSAKSKHGLTIYGSDEGSLQAQAKWSKIKTKTQFYWVHRENNTYSLLSRQRVQLGKFTMPRWDKMGFHIIYTQTKSDSTHYWSTQLKHSYSLSRSKLQSSLTLKPPSYQGHSSFPAYIQWRNLKPKNTKQTFFLNTWIKWRTPNIHKPLKQWELQVSHAWPISKEQNFHLRSYMELPFKYHRIQQDLYYKLNFNWSI